MTKHAVICLWANEHTTPGGPDDTSTVIFEPDEDYPFGGFKCLHAHCHGRTLKDVIGKLGASPSGDSIPAPKEGLGQATNFRPVTALQLLTEPLEKLDWVWYPYLPTGTLCLLAAYMKVGKSTFAYGLAHAVGSGQNFLGSKTKKGGVLILAVEEHRRDVKIRLGLLGMVDTDLIHLHAGPLDPSSETLNALRDYIITQGIVLVILDTLSRYWNISDENDNARVIRALSPLLDLARESNVTILLVHHERKAGGEEGRSIRGGSALFSLVDQALILERRQGGERTHRVLRAIGRYSETPADQVLDYTVNVYRLVGPADQFTHDTAKATILAALDDEPRVVESIAEMAGATPKVTRALLKLLVAEGLVVQEGRGVKGDAHTFRRALKDSILSQPHSYREGMHSQSGDAENESEGSLSC